MLFLLFVLALFLIYLFAEMTKIFIVIEKRDPFAGVSTQPGKNAKQILRRLRLLRMTPAGVVSRVLLPDAPISARTAS